MNQDFKDMLNTPDNSSMYDTQDIQDNKIWGALSYLGILFFLPLVVNGGSSKFGRFHANQAFILLIADIIGGVLSSLLGKIPVLGSVLSALISLLLLAYTLFGIITAGSGKAKELPFIGGLMHVFDK